MQLDLNLCRPGRAIWCRRRMSMASAISHDLVLVGRSTVLIKGIAAKLNITWSLAKQWVRTSVPLACRWPLQQAVMYDYDRAFTVRRPGPKSCSACRPCSSPTTHKD